MKAIPKLGVFNVGVTREFRDCVTVSAFDEEGAKMKALKRFSGLIAFGLITEVKGQSVADDSAVCEVEND